MIRLLADNNADGHVEVLIRFFLSEEWIVLWNALELTSVSFEDLNLRRNASDEDIWEACQREQVLLITGNRNAIGPDSLERILRERNSAQSLPVFTLANPDRIGVDRSYAEATAISLLDYLMRLDEIRGMGRIYIP